MNAWETERAHPGQQQPSGVLSGAMEQRAWAAGGRHALGGLGGCSWMTHQWHAQLDTSYYFMLELHSCGSNVTTVMCYIRMKCHLVCLSVRLSVGQDCPCTSCRSATHPRPRHRRKSRPRKRPDFPNPVRAPNTSLVTSPGRNQASSPWHFETNTFVQCP